MEFLDPRISEYVDQHTQEEPGYLSELNRETHLKALKPRMLSGHLQGRILSMFSHMIRPEKVLDIGTYTGYSTLCFAEGLQENGKVHTIDNNEELEGMARDYFKRSGMEDKIEFHLGVASEVIKGLQETWDLVFIDADKANYINYYEQIFNNVRTGGYIIADNVLWSGKVLNEKEAVDEDTRTLMEYNEMVQKDDRVENVLLPVRDGLMVVRKV